MCGPKPQIITQYFFSWGSVPINPLETWTLWEGYSHNQRPTEFSLCYSLAMEPMASYPTSLSLDCFICKRRIIVCISEGLLWGLNRTMCVGNLIQHPLCSRSSALASCLSLVRHHTALWAAGQCLMPPASPTCSLPSLIKAYLTWDLSPHSSVPRTDEIIQARVRWNSMDITFLCYFIRHCRLHTPNSSSHRPHPQLLSC